MIATVSPSAWRSPRKRRLLATLASIGALASMGYWTTPAESAQAAASAVRCTQVNTPVTFTGGSGHIAGTLCVPAGGARTVQLLVHGYSYARYYWDFPFKAETYSYARRANQAGYATLAIDRLGDGASTHPLGADLTWDNAVSTVHQVVTALRNGRLGKAFNKVILVGHSYGSVTGYLVAGKYHDVDAMIVEGAAHRVNMVNVGLMVTAQSPPAMLDPKFAGRGYDPLYVTTRAGKRSVFYRVANTDTRVIALDEKLKETGGSLEIPTVAVYLADNPSTTTNIPVLTVDGDQDPFFCGLLAANCSSDQALANFERPFYGPRATVEAYVIHGGGHDINLERTAPLAYDRMLKFANQYVGK